MARTSARQAVTQRPVGGTGAPCRNCRGCGTRLSMGKRAALLAEAWIKLYPAEVPNASAMASAAASGDPQLVVAAKISAVNEVIRHKRGTIVKLIAISEAESSGYTNDVNCDSNGTADYGWTQINSSNGGSPASFDPATAAEQMLRLLHTPLGLANWSTYRGARYTAALPAAAAAVAGYGLALIQGGQGVSTQLAQTEAANAAAGGCVYGWKLPSVGLKVAGHGPSLGGETICFDVLIGGLKMTAGGLGVLVSVLSLAFSVRKLEPTSGGAVAEASGQVRRNTAVVVRTGTRPATALRRQARSAGSRRAATARAAEQTAARQRTEARADYNARTARLRASSQSSPRTVYVTDEDPMADTYKRRAATQARHRAQERAEAQRRHGDPDAPPF